MKQLYYLSVQPATRYYAWQVEVMLNNFVKHGISPKQIQILGSTENDHVPIEWLKLQDKHRDISFFFYNDTRRRKEYAPSIRPHLFKKHFGLYPELKDAVIFQHDCDIVFTKSVSWDKFLNDDIWYLSDTVSYIGAEYIKSKKYGVYERMCEIIGIDEEVPEKNQENSGGAQYLMKNLTAEYWTKVETDCELLHNFFTHHHRAFPETPKYLPIQAWTAEMWSVLWNAWYFKHETKVVKELGFSWPMNKISNWDSQSIFHNSGVIGNEKEKLFYKGLYLQQLPYNIKLDDYSVEHCSHQYVREILETAKTSCLL